VNEANYWKLCWWAKMSIEKDAEAIKAHDTFNIISLVIIISIVITYLCFATEFPKIGTDLLGIDHIQIFYILFVVFSTYLIIDCFIIYIFPKCVLSNPTTILYHHFATFLLILIPFYENQFAWHMSACLIVEINTLFLTVRRNSTKAGLIWRVSEILFYISWVILRLILFPILCVFFSFEYYRYSLSSGSFINFVLFAPILQILLTFLSILWTIEIIKKKFTKNTEKHE
jgi:hypothetical protein